MNECNENVQPLLLNKIYQLRCGGGNIIKVILTQLFWRAASSLLQPILRTIKQCPYSPKVNDHIAPNLGIVRFVFEILEALQREFWSEIFLALFESVNGTFGLRLICGVSEITSSYLPVTFSRSRMLNKWFPGSLLMQNCFLWLFQVPDRYVSMILAGF